MKRKLLLIIASMLLGGAVFAQDFYWEGWDYHAFRFHMNIIGRAYFDGELQSRPNIEIATFVNGELRGTKYLVEPYPNFLPGEYYVWNGCYYDAEGETFTFMAYDHDNNILYDICDTELIGQQNGHGTMDEPLQMHFTRTVEPTYGPDYPWVPSTAYSGEGMLVTAQVKINGVLVDRDSYEVGAFCGEECRANSQELIDFTDDDLGYFAMMNIVGNNGDIINFYLYDQESSSIFPGVCNTTIELVNGGELGIDIYGGDIFVLNFVTEQTFTKNIIGYGTSENGGYYLIASPINGVSPTDVTNMIGAHYDLFSFNQSGDDQGKEWMNYKAGAFTQLESGMGYLYANSETVDLIFTGMPIDATTYDIDLVYDAEASDPHLKGWNLVGNPFTEIAYIANYEDYNFYTMNSAGDDLEAATNNSIEAMEGIFVVAQGENESITFTTTNPIAGDKAMLALNLSNGRNVIDRTIVRFGEGRALPKFQLNPNHTKVYMPVEGIDYAVVYSEGQGEMPVNFMAEKNGTYTLSFSSEEVNFGYLHLIDNMTGADVNLLETPSYSFNACTTDYASRFKLVFATGNCKDDTFSFFSNGNWIINNNGEAILQVVDVTGRIMSSEEIHGSCSKHIEAAPGVYMLRLIQGNDVKVQKIVLE